MENGAIEVRHTVDRTDPAEQSVVGEPGALERCTAVEPSSSEQRFFLEVGVFEVGRPFEGCVAENAVAAEVHVFESGPAGESSTAEPDIANTAASDVKMAEERSGQVELDVRPVLGSILVKVVTGVQVIGDDALRCSPDLKLLGARVIIVVAEVRLRCCGRARAGLGDAQG